VSSTRLDLATVRKLLLRATRLLRPLASHLAAIVTLSVTAIAAFTTASLWLVFRVVWDLVGYGSAPATWELELLGIGRTPSAALREAIAAAAAPRLVLLSLAGTMVALGLGYYGIWLLQRINQLLRLALFDRYQALSLRFHADATVGDLIYRLYQDSAVVTQILSAVFVQPLFALGTLTIGAGVLALLAPPYVLAPLLAVPLVLVAARLFSEPLRVRFRLAREAQSGLTACVQETALGIRAVKAYGNEQLLQRRFEEASRLALRRALAARGLFAVYKTALFLALGAAAAVVALLATMRAAAAPPLPWPLFGMSVFGLAAYNAAKMLSGMALGSIRDLGTLWGRAQDMLIGLARAFEVLDRLPEVQDAPGATPLAPLARTIELREVWFDYEPGVPALRGASLVLRVGEVVALVGPTGAGKSTLLALLARFFDPDRGAVLVDGRDIRTATVGSVRAQTAIAFQEHVLFGATVAENLRYGWPDAPEAALRAAAEVACADEFIRGLPEGYDTPLGERGSKLSTGQRQRLGIARALLREAPILLLDEPTAALDPETERRLLGNLREWARGRCVLLVTHRISTAQAADRVVFLEAGRVVEEGMHAELLARSEGRYRTFMDAHS
jgi:ABC-type multidrug transport system fused ATPase/permease subunit